jgi:nucleoside-triphosphatase THEP1
MNNQTGTSDLTYYRLIALWVLNEAMLGGIIHGLKIPVSGLIVGSCAVVCICLIAWYVPKKGAILKATLIVAIFKMMLSPQAPPPAYLAVFFQGLLGELLFWNRRFFKLSCLLLALLALLESGLQRIVVLTIIYGNGLWKAINDFINGLTKQKTATNYSLLIGGAYVLLHVIVGLLVGWFAALLPGRVEKWQSAVDNRQWAVGSLPGSMSVPVRNTRKKRLRIGLLIVWFLLIALYIQSYFKIGPPLLPAHVSLKILLRSIIIVLAWYFIIGPLLRRLLHYWLQKKKERSQTDIQKVLELLPATQALLVESWKKQAGKTGWGKISAWTSLILVNALKDPHEEKRIYILTGPIQSGKTTSLVNWSAGRNDVAGILTPVINGKRVFMNANSDEQFQMEASEEESEVLKVGRFVFSGSGFRRAIQVIRDSLHTEGWLVIDEIGPMELRGEGFSGVLREVLEERNGKTLLVVREGLVEKVKEVFKIGDARNFTQRR